MPFVEQTARYLGRLDSGPPSVPVGSFAELRDSKENGAAVDVVDPKGERVLSLAEATKAQNIQFTLAGFYDIRRPNGRNELVAVNADRHESDLTPIPQETLAFVAEYSQRDFRERWGSFADRAETAFAVVVRDAGGVGCLRWPSRCWGINIFLWTKRRHETFGSLVRVSGRASSGRLRLLALSRGAAVTAAAALALTVVAVLVANQFAFSDPSVIGARVFLFLGLAFALAAALIVPVIRLNRRHAARKAETSLPAVRRAPAHLHRTHGAERPTIRSSSCWPPIPWRSPSRPSRARSPGTPWIFSFSSAAVGAALALLWLGTSGPGFLGYGTSLLWGGLPKGEMKPFYSIKVDPGNKTIRKRADQMITATLLGFTAPKVRFFAKYASASKWEQAEMRTEPGGSAYQFLIAGVPESLEYYVEAGGVRSPSYKLNVVDLPSVKKHPGHLPLPRLDRHEGRRGGSRRRPARGGRHHRRGRIQTDRPLATGAILLDDGSKLPLRAGGNGAVVASVPIQKDGMYHIAAVESGEDVRLSEDYFIEAQKDQPPEIKITRPGRDFSASPIEEVTVGVDAKDDFGLKDVDLALLRERRRREGRPHAARGGRQDLLRQRRPLARGFQGGARRYRQPVRHCQRRPQDRQHRHVLHRSAAVRTQLHPVAAGRRRWRRRRRCRAAEPDLAAAEGNHHRHLESDQGPGRHAAPTPKTPRSWPPSSPSCATRPNRWPIA